AIVFEAIPSAVTEALMPKMEIPVIGIGAGPSTDGQVLVLHDVLGVYDGHQAKFVKRFAEVRAQSLKAVRAYTEDVRARKFPAEEQHTYSISQEELEEYARCLEEESLVGTETPWDW